MKDNTQNKCDKYESLFIFGVEAELLEHIKECPDCQRVHEKMNKVSSLVKETKFHFKQNRKKQAALRTICASLLLVFTFGAIGLHSSYTDYTIKAAYNNAGYISDMGLPTDEYGLLLAD